jgi:di/tricarboxylate transporter
MVRRPAFGRSSRPTILRSVLLPGGREAKDFVRSGLVLIAVAVALVILLGMTYWHWLGFV